MKILFSITYYYPYISGLTLYCQRLSESLARRGFKCTVITAQYEKKLATKEIVSNVRVRRVPYLFKLSKGFFLPKWLPVSVRQVRKNDIVIINLPQFEGFITALWARMLGKKVISIYHCEISLPKGFLNKQVEVFLHLSNLVSLFLSDKIISYTEDYARNSRLLPFFKKKSLFVYPPIQTTKNRQQITKNKEQTTDNKEQTMARIGFAGRIAAEKGIEYLLRALPLIKTKNRQQKTDNKKQKSGINIKNIKLIIAGPNPVREEKYNRKLKNLVEKHREQIVFTGPLVPLGDLREKYVKSHADAKNLNQFQTMEDFYQAIDVLVLPSVNSTEGFGMVQVEAMMFGVPVVASNLPGVRIPIKETKMGEIVSLRNSKALAKAIVKVLTNRKKYIKSREKIEKIFNFQKTLAFYERLFKTLVA